MARRPVGLALLGDRLSLTWRDRGVQKFGHLSAWFRLLLGSASGREASLHLDFAANDPELPSADKQPSFNLLDAANRLVERIRTEKFTELFWERLLHGVEWLRTGIRPCDCLLIFALPIDVSRGFVRCLADSAETHELEVRFIFTPEAAALSMARLPDRPFAWTDESEDPPRYWATVDRPDAEGPVHICLRGESVPSLFSRHVAPLPDERYRGSGGEETFSLAVDGALTTAEQILAGRKPRISRPFFLRLGLDWGRDLVLNDAVTDSGEMEEGAFASAVRVPAGLPYDPAIVLFATPSLVPSAPRFTLGRRHLARPDLSAEHSTHLVQGEVTGMFSGSWGMREESRGGVEFYDFGFPWFIQERTRLTTDEMLLAATPEADRKFDHILAIWPGEERLLARAWDSGQPEAASTFSGSGRLVAVGTDPPVTDFDQLDLPAGEEPPAPKGTALERFAPASLLRSSRIRRKALLDSMVDLCLRGLGPRIPSPSRTLVGLVVPWRTSRTGVHDLVEVLEERGFAAVHAVFEAEGCALTRATSGSGSESGIGRDRSGAAYEWSLDRDELTVRGPILPEEEMAGLPDDPLPGVIRWLEGTASDTVRLRLIRTGVLVVQRGESGYAVMDLAHPDRPATRLLEPDPESDEALSFHVVRWHDSGRDSRSLDAEFRWPEIGGSAADAICVKVTVGGTEGAAEVIPLPGGETSQIPLKIGLP